MADPTTPASASAAATNMGRPVRFAVVGTSWITAALIDAGLSVRGFELVAVSSRDAAKAAEFAAPYGDVRVHTSLAALGADPDIDAVYVASPNSMHARQTIELLRAGKNVLCEKPLAATEAQATAMFAAANESGRLLMEAYTTPFEPNYLAITDHLAAVGRVRRAVFSKDQYSSRYDQLKAGNLTNAFNPAFAAGSLMDIGFYTVAPAVQLFGVPLRISATGILLSSGVDGQGTIVLGYEDHEVIGLHSKIAQSALDSVITGESGTITANDASVPTRVSFTDLTGEARDLSRRQSHQHMRYEVEHFVALVQAGATTSPVRSPERSMATLAILDECRRQVGVRFPADDQPL